MTLEECYRRIGGDYQDFVHRIGGEHGARRVLAKFLQDDSLDRLGAALARWDYGAAFTAAHALKGIALSLSFAPLMQSAAALCEALYARQGEKCILDLFQQVQGWYGSIRATVEKAV